MASSGDRRQRKRVRVHWPGRLFQQPDRLSVESTTENLSSEGLYCITRKAFNIGNIGESLLCEIVIPGENFGAGEPTLRLQCHITIKRVERLDRGFGLGCHIEDYSLATP